MALTTTRAGEYHDPAIKPLLDAYRQVVAQRYTPCAPSDMSRLLAAPPYHVSRKVDGELWFLAATAQGNLLIAANGRVATGDAPILNASLPVGTVLAGELHAAGDGRERVGAVQSGLAAGGDGLAFAAFDLIAHGEQTWRELTYPSRLEVLRSLLPAQGAAFALDVTTVESDSDVAAIFNDVVVQKQAEGLIVRCSDGRALKIKPELTVDLAILGYTVREGGRGSEVRSILLGLSTPSGQWVPVGSTGNLMEGMDRVALLGLLEPLHVESSFRRAASSGQLYRITRPEVLVECRVVDIQSEDSRGLAVRQPELSFLSDHCEAMGQTTAISLINAIAQRLRTDKPDTREGARWEQIADRVALPGPAVSTTTAVDVIRRQVWTKTGKDKSGAEKTDVRKLVVWKTNRDHEDPSYPAFVVHWTDYSAGRKAPLAREVRPAPTRAAAELLAEAMITENIKKGWELIG